MYSHAITLVMTWNILSIPKSFSCTSVMNFLLSHIVLILVTVDLSLLSFRLIGSAVHVFLLLPDLGHTQWPLGSSIPCLLLMSVCAVWVLSCSWLQYCGISWFFPVFVLMYVFSRGYHTLEGLGSTWNRIDFPDFIPAFLTISHMLRLQGCFQYLLAPP